MDSISPNNEDRGEQKRLQRKREADYRQQIEDQEKRHREQVNSIRKQHVKEIRRIAAINDKNMTSMQEATRNSLSEKDQFYQNEIDRIQDLHRNSQKKLSQDYEGKLTRTRQKAAEDVEQNTRTNRLQRQVLEKTYSDQVEKADAKFREYVDRSQGEQAKALTQLRDEMNTHKKKEMDSVLGAHSRKVEGLEYKLEEQRRTKGNENRKLREQVLFQKQELSDDFQRVRERERDFYDQIIETNHRRHSAGIQSVKNKYQNALADYKESQEMARENLTNNTRERINNKVKSLEHKLASEKRRNVAKEIDLNNQNDIEKLNIREQMRDSIFNVQKQRDNALSGMKDKHDLETKDLHRKFDNLTDRQSKFYQSQINTMKEQHKREVTSNTSFYEARNKQVENKADQRVGLILNDKIRDEKNMRTYFNDALKQMQDVHEQDILDQRSKMLEERRTIVGRLHEQVHNLEAKHASREEVTRNKYEAEFDRIKEDARRKDLRVKKDHERTVANLKKQHDRELLEVKQKMEARIQDLQKQQDEVIDRLGKRHQEVVERLVTTKS